MSWAQTQIPEGEDDRINQMPDDFKLPCQIHVHVYFLYYFINYQESERSSDVEHQVHNEVGKQFDMVSFKVTSQLMF